MRGSAIGVVTRGVSQRWSEASLVKDRQVNSGGNATITCTKVPSRYWRIASEAKPGNPGTKIPIISRLSAKLYNRVNKTQSRPT